MIPDIFKDVSPTSLLLLLYAIDFALLTSFFHHRNLSKKITDDFVVYIRYFVNFFILLFVIPVVFILFSYSRPLEALASLGLRAGDVRFGFLVLLIGIPVTIVLISIAAKDPALKDHYPFSKRACLNSRSFFLYEASYLIFYYTAWEFAFRGVLLFALIELMGDTPTGVIAAISVQSLLATVYHLGHPHVEIIGALLGSIIFGAIAYATGSIFYTIFLHAFAGILNDILIYRKYHRKP